MGEYRRFVVPYDFSVHAEGALAVAIDLAQRLGAELHLVHVLQPPAYSYGSYDGGVAVPPPFDPAEARDSAMRSLREVVDRIVATGFEKLEPHVAVGSNIAEMIRTSAENLGADLIVMGTHGRTGLAHVFLGSVAERTLRGAPCPVLTVQASEASNQ